MRFVREFFAKRFAEFRKRYEARARFEYEKATGKRRMSGARVARKMSLVFVP